MMIKTAVASVWPGAAIGVAVAEAFLLLFQKREVQEITAAVANSLTMQGAFIFFVFSIGGGMLWLLKKNNDILQQQVLATNNNSHVVATLAANLDRLCAETAHSNQRHEDRVSDATDTVHVKLDKILEGINDLKSR